MLLHCWKDKMKCLDFLLERPFLKKIFQLGGSGGQHLLSWNATFQACKMEGKNVLVLKTVWKILDTSFLGDNRHFTKKQTSSCLWLEGLSDLTLLLPSILWLLLLDAILESRKVSIFQITQTYGQKYMLAGGKYKKL